jgi:transposase-like protein
MVDENELPKTLQEAIRYFSDELLCINFVAGLRWENGIAICPHCSNDTTSFLATRKIWKCKACKKQFSVKVGTIFEDSPIKLDKWLMAIWLIAGAKNGISSYELHRAIGITQKSAWFVLHRIRVAMQAGSFEKLSGTIEADETYIGGDSKNMHASKRKRFEMRSGRKDHKTAVLGLVQRQGKVRAKVVPNARSKSLVPVVRENVQEGSELYTDSLQSYELLASDYVHEVINHSVEYVRGNVHTNSVENFWSLLKRTIRGTYVSVAPEHLQKYVEEQAFRYNERKGTDKTRFCEVVKSVSGKRLTYAQLIGLQPEGH